MNTLIETLQEAGSNPYSWLTVALMFAITAYSLYRWRTCPYLCHTKEISDSESRSRVDEPFVAGKRFIIVMIAGIAAILVGLSLVSRQVNPPLALLLIVLGVFAVQIEPALLRIRESTERLVAAQVQGPEQIAAATERLRYAHIWLVIANFAIMLSVILALLAF